MSRHDTAPQHGENTQRAVDRRFAASPGTDHLRAGVERGRHVLQQERRRVRPDSWELAWSIVESSAELLPQWDSMQAKRGADALVVEDIVCRYLPQSLEAFLEIPDSKKPAAAPELLDQLSLMSAELRRAIRRLHGAQRTQLEAVGDVLRLRFSGGHADD
ncbi:MAG: hypothetical protein Q4G34_10865 [Micrococcus sp.]|nr:hypothetical protein [Micrococcus sp.]